MKFFTGLLCLLLSASAFCQDPILAANKCYDEKNYECAAGKYREALADKKYKEADFALIKYRIGYSLNSISKFADAIPYLQEALTAKPTMSDAQWALSYSYYSTASYTKAAEGYGKTMEFYKNDTASLKSLHYWKGKSLAANLKYTDALNSYKEAIRIDSTNEDYYASSGDANYNAGNYLEAIKSYRKAISIGSGTKPAATAARYYWIGGAYYALLDYDQALIGYKKALEYVPEHKNSIWGIASVYYGQKKWKESIDQYTRAMGYFKGDSINLAIQYVWRGSSYSMLNEYEKALADYDMSLKLDPLADGVEWKKATVLKNQKKHKEAIVQYNKAISLMDEDFDDADLDDIYFFRGFCHLQVKDTASAEKDFKQSLNYNRNLRDPNVFMGQISYARKKYYEAKNYYGSGIVGYKTDSITFSRLYFEKAFSNYVLGDTYFYTAKEDFQKSISFDPLNKEAHRYLADAHYRQSSFLLAEKELTTTLDLYKKTKDSLPAIYIQRALSRWQQKKYKDALSDYEQSDKLLPITNTETIKSMGQLAFEVKEYEKAGKFFGRLLPMYKPEQKNELLFVYFARGRISIELKKKEPAVKDLKKALELSPGNKDVETWLARAEAL